VLMNRELRYRDAGVDRDAATAAKRRIAEMVRSTFSPGVLQDIGSFGALYQLDTGQWNEPVLVSSIDSVGTKLKIAFMTGKHDTVGIDIVAHCVNDILTMGARPLFVMDYLGVGKLEPGIVEEVISGLVTGCIESGCALIGGETAELPGFYAEGEYDLAACIVGIVEKSKVVDGSSVVEGDVLVGLASSGLHTNGYSLARKIVFDICGLKPDDQPEGCNRTVAEELLEPHRSYARIVLPLLDAGTVHGMAHITGGGITENLPRTLPPGLGAEIDKSTWDIPPIFSFLQKNGNVPEDEMFRTFNMGIGFVLVVPPDGVEPAIAQAKEHHRDAHVIGRIVSAENPIQWK
jgi:phosphoribosylformylglycinamidine cyclo-ligase